MCLNLKGKLSLNKTLVTYRISFSVTLFCCMVGQVMAMSIKKLISNLLSWQQATNGSIIAREGFIADTIDETVWQRQVKTH